VDPPIFLHRDIIRFSMAYSVNENFEVGKSEVRNRKNKIQFRYHYSTEGLNMGRPKGRRYQQYKIYLTPLQIEWLQRPEGGNSSAFFRSLLTSHMRKQIENLYKQTEEESKRLEALKIELDAQDPSLVNQDYSPPPIFNLKMNIEITKAKILQAKSEIRKLEKCLGE
jgi:hypothetical protein